MGKVFLILFVMLDDMQHLEHLEHVPIWKTSAKVELRVNNYDQMVTVAVTKYMNSILEFTRVLKCKL